MFLGFIKGLLNGLLGKLTQTSFIVQGNIYQKKPKKKFKKVVYCFFDEIE